MKPDDLLLVLNAGSSSLKFGLYRAGETAPARLARGQFRDLDGAARFVVQLEDGAAARERPSPARTPEQALAALLEWLEERYPGLRLAAAGHRVVHGGPRFAGPRVVDSGVLAALHELVSLAPLHMPHNLAGIEQLQRLRPDLPQVACFDTAFHHGLPLREQYYALPREWHARGVRRYGFHGLSYESIAERLPSVLGAAAEGRVIVAHLGHGASLCALHERRSQATTMGFTPLDGVPMATRPGQLDPGIPLWLQREAGLDVAAVEDLLNHRSGLLGLSGTSGDMRELLHDPRPEAAEAIDHFVYHVHRAIASLAAVLGGLDALVFTAGIGENAPLVRERIVREARWLGLQLDAEANAENRTRISLPDSPVSVWVIPTDEEQRIAHHTRSLLTATAPGESP